MIPPTRSTENRYEISGGRSILGCLGEAAMDEVGELAGQLGTELMKRPRR
jgi:hypothetical protein